MKKVVLISGGSDGLGHAIAARLIPHHTVVIMSNDGPKCLKVASELGCSCVVGDVSDYAAMERAVKSTIERHGGLDVIINNAGIWIEGELDTNEPERIRRVIEVNTLGVINLTRAALPFLKHHRRGRIINIISQAGVRAKPGKSVYDASKFAITGFTKSLQLELAPYHIGVTGVYPGKLKTKLFEKAGFPKAMDDALPVDQVAATVQLIVDADPATQILDIGLQHI